ncbi:unnamed protein product [Candidula unifasciata]|uniref:Sarcoplasmic reticulum histidine-rich calcium-binding protein-like n=1 Tax=Candidula unifasciata TaxID=100452 RepID=A0A8S3ZS75_9EUPU|nr:unnamed protein product [Candidula unifasciata]
MKKMSARMLLILLVVLAVKLSNADSEDEEAHNDDTSDSASVANEPVDEEKVEYARGSVCGYCTYCKVICKYLFFLLLILYNIECSLMCDKDCPCERSKTKPNCHMCKYCKYCYLCSAFCDTICTPGGVLDRVSGAIVNSLPSFSKEEVEEDIASVKTWIEQKKDEL